MKNKNNHHQKLYDKILIKKNHILLTKKIHPTLKTYQKRIHHLQKIKIEITSLKKLNKTLNKNTNTILLNNIKPEIIIKTITLTQNHCPLKISKNVNQNNLQQYTETNVNFISLKTLTHSTKTININLIIISN